MQDCFVSMILAFSTPLLQEKILPQALTGTADIFSLFVNFVYLVPLMNRFYFCFKTIDYDQ